MADDATAVAAPAPDDTTAAPAAAPPAAAPTQTTSAGDWANAIIQHESGGDPNAVGDSGLAVGMGQMHPEVRKAYGVTPQSTPEEQRAAVNRYFNDLWQKHQGNPENAVKEYHLGEPNFKAMQGGDAGWKEDADNYFAGVKSKLGGGGGGGTTAAAPPKPSASQYLASEAFWNAPAETRVRALSRVSPAFAAATPELQRQYLEHKASSRVSAAPEAEKNLTPAPTEQIDEGPNPVFGGRRYTDTDVEKMRGRVNSRLGLPEDHPVGHFLANWTGRMNNAVADSIEGLPELLKPLLTGITPSSIPQIAEGAGKTLSPLAAGPEAVGETYRYTAEKGGFSPSTSALIGTIASLGTSMLIPMPKGLAPGASKAADAAVMGETELMAAAKSGNQGAMARLARIWANAAEEFHFGEVGRTRGEEIAATGAAGTTEQTAAAAEAAVPQVAATGKAEVKAAGQRGAQWVGAARETAGEATTAAQQEAAKAAEGATAAETAAAPGPEAGARTQATLYPEGTTPAAGSQAAAGALQSTLSREKDWWGRLYNTFVESHADETPLSPEAAQGLSAKLVEIRDTLGPLWSGKAAEVLDTVEGKLSATSAAPVTVKELDEASMQLDDIFKGAKVPTRARELWGETQRSIKSALRANATPEERAALEVADQQWATKLVDPRVGRNLPPRALSRLTALAKKDPETFAVRVLGKGTKEEEGLAAQAVANELRNDPDALTQLRAAQMKKLWSPDEAGGVDPASVLKRYSNLDPNYRTAMTTPEAREFFDAEKAIQAAVKPAQEAAGAAGQKAAAVAEEGKAAVASAKAAVKPGVAAVSQEQAANLAAARSAAAGARETAAGAAEEATGATRRASAAYKAAHGKGEGSIADVNARADAIEEQAKAAGKDVSRMALWAADGLRIVLPSMFVRAALGHKYGVLTDLAGGYALARNTARFVIAPDKLARAINTLGKPLGWALRTSLRAPVAETIARKLLGQDQLPKEKEEEANAQ